MGRGVASDNRDVIVAIGSHDEGGSNAGAAHECDPLNVIPAHALDAGGIEATFVIFRSGLHRERAGRMQDDLVPRRAADGITAVHEDGGCGGGRDINDVVAGLAEDLEIVHVGVVDRFQSSHRNQAAGDGDGLAALGAEDRQVVAASQQIDGEGADVGAIDHRRGADGRAAADEAHGGGILAGRRNGEVVVAVGGVDGQVLGAGVGIEQLNAEQGDGGAVTSHCRGGQIDRHGTGGRAQIDDVTG